MENIILVDLDDKEIGVMEKQEAHVKAKLHRAFSILLFHKDKILIQQRANHKYHCGGLWANTCCSHPRVNESLEEATKRRLLQETGIECELSEIGSFLYCAPFSNGLTEYEIDHVFVGEYGGEFIINREEVETLQYVEIEWLKQDMMEHPDVYAPWFFTAFYMALQKRKEK